MDDKRLIVADDLNYNLFMHMYKLLYVQCVFVCVRYS